MISNLHVNSPQKHIVRILSILFVLLCCHNAPCADQIRVGYGPLSTSYSAIWVAGEARLFRKNGIDAEVLFLESALVRTALITGDIAVNPELTNAPSGSICASKTIGIPRKPIRTSGILCPRNPIRHGRS